MIKFIAFDIDGVIYDSSNFIEQAYSEAINIFCDQNPDLSLSKPRKSDIVFLIGKTYKEIVSSLFPYLADNYHENFRRILLEILDKKIRNLEGTLIENSIEVIKNLYNQNYILGTASNGSAIYCNAVLQTYQIDRYFKEIQYVDFVEFISKKDILAYYLKKYSFKPSELLMVGDRLVDLQAAKANNVYFCGIVGHGNLSEIADSDFIINSIDFLPTILTTF
ncbi:MAG: HAD family hydrolase [Exilispira sp.]